MKHMEVVDILQTWFGLQLHECIVKLIFIRNYMQNFSTATVEWYIHTFQYGYVNYFYLLGAVYTL